MAGVTLGTEDRRALDGARTFRRHRHELQAAQVERLGRELPLPQLHTPQLLAAAIGPDELVVLADALAAGVGSLDAGSVGRRAAR